MVEIFEKIAHSFDSYSKTSNSIAYKLVSKERLLDGLICECLNFKKILFQNKVMAFQRWLIFEFLAKNCGQQEAQKC